MSDPISPVATTPELRHPHEIWIIKPPRQRLWLHIVLLLATFVSTLVVGARIQNNFESRQPAFSFADENVSMFPVEWIWEAPAKLAGGLSFSLALMFILLAHEMGHYFYARHYRVYATLPYFVPFPSLIGTLGAFIRIKTPIPSRSALFDIGIAGPIAGFIPACVAVLVGLSLSQPLASLSTVPDNEPGFPLAFKFAASLLHIHGLGSLSLHPIAVAGWVGMFATALNLLPAGQLDGGHILFAVFPKLHRTVSFLTVLALIPFGKYFWMGWFLWAIVLWLTSLHPPVPDSTGITKGRKWLAVAAIAMLVFSFTPAPLTHASGKEKWPQIHETGRDSFRWGVDTVRHWLHRN